VSKRFLKRYGGLIARILLATLGVVYLAYALNWTDHVQLPARITIDGVTIEETIEAPVVERDETTVVVRIHRDTVIRIPWADFTGEPDAPQLRPGIVQTFLSADVRWLVAGLLIAAPMFALQIVRWGLLMACRGLPAPPARVAKLYMVGAFFNTFMPGMTGGDVIKAYYAARDSSRRAATVISILVDRTVGMIALVLLALIASLVINLPEPFAPTVRAIWIVAGVVLAGAAVYLTPWLRRGLGITWLMNRMHEAHLLRRIDDAIYAYRGHRWAVLGGLGLSVIAHIANITAAAFCGWAVGLPTGFGTLLTVMPVGRG